MYNDISASELQKSKSGLIQPQNFLDIEGPFKPTQKPAWRDSLIPTDFEIRIAAKRLGLPSQLQEAAYVLTGRERRQGATPMSARELGRELGKSIRSAQGYIRRLTEAGLLIASGGAYLKTNVGEPRQEPKIRRIRISDEAMNEERIRKAEERRRERMEAYAGAALARKVAAAARAVADAATSAVQSLGDLFSVHRNASFCIGTQIEKQLQADFVLKYGKEALEMLPDRGECHALGESHPMRRT